MPYEELLDWYEYFDRRPVGWRDDDRTAKLLQAQGVKEKPDKLFSSLQKIYNVPKSKDIEDTLTKSVKGSWFGQLMQHAVGGDKLND